MKEKTSIYQSPEIAVMQMVTESVIAGSQVDSSSAGSYVGAMEDEEWF